MTKVRDMDVSVKHYFQRTVKKPRASARDNNSIDPLTHFLHFQWNYRFNVEKSAFSSGFWPVNYKLQQTTFITKCKKCLTDSDMKDDLANDNCVLYQNWSAFHCMDGVNFFIHFTHDMIRLPYCPICLTSET